MTMADSSSFSSCSSSSPRTEFQPDGIPATGHSGSNEAPALSASTALARFEFEPGRGNEGTKILMVEWEDPEDGTTDTGNWEISWEGKKTKLGARDGAEGTLHRIYFLLGPGTNIPPVVKLAQAGGKVIQTNPLPAIFPAELGASATTAGKLGVLHTVWAKKRLSVLKEEIEIEMKTNGEGVGLEMAMQEKQWIEDNFGIGPRPIPDLSSPASPKTPVGGRLSEKLKGLRLGTSASALSSPPVTEPLRTEPSRTEHPLSPDLGDVAVSSFSLFHSASGRVPTRAVAQSPPGYLVARQGDSRGGSRINSLDAVTRGDHPRKDDNETEDDLFAVKLSPRSPEMTKSPFSFAAKDTVPWLKNNES